MKATKQTQATATQTAAETQYTLVSPRGKQHTVSASQLSKLASRYNLDASNLRKVANGTRTQHKGWSRGNA